MSADHAIGLPPPKDAPAPAPTPSALWRARAVNLLGVLPPLSNLGLLSVARRERRWFGLGAGIVCALAYGYSRWKDVEWVGAAGVGVYGFLVIVGLVHPLWVARIGDLWAAFGTLLGKVMSYPIFTIVYFLAVTPTALVVRAFGKDPLGEKRRGAATYWTPHEPPPKERYERQF
jgi:hypothetical protein